jgi:hypothetical protein
MAAAGYLPSSLEPLPARPVPARSTLGISAMLMLIDTHDPRYPRRPDREPEPDRPKRPRRRAAVPLRLWLPLALAIACLVATSWVPPVAGYGLVLVSLCLFGRAGSVMLPPIDGLREHRQ